MSGTTPIVSIDPAEPDRPWIARAARILREGGLVAFATETVYGLGADATNPEAVARIFAAKGRPATNPLIVHVHDVAMARTCVRDWPPEAEALARAFWPGPLTLVLPRSGIIPDVVTAGGESVGVRVPRTWVARDLIQALGRPIAAPSANRSTGVSPTVARHVAKDLDGRIDLILDSGPTTVGLESTVLDLTTRQPRILRPGSITAEQIGRALGGLRVREVGAEADAAGPLASPGRMAVHYAPRARSIRVDPERIPEVSWPARAALLVFDPQDVPPVPDSVLRYDCLTPETAEIALYALLHACDDAGLDLIVVVPPPDRPEWRAVRDRLWRATRPWPSGSPD